MKVIIVGAGVSGLSTYLFLRKILASYDISISIYEKHPVKDRLSNTDNTNFEDLTISSALIGGGIGLQPNGMRILKELGQDLHDAVVARGCVCESFMFKSARGWQLSKSPSGDMRKEDGEEFCVAMSRHELWESLQEKAEKEGAVVNYRKITGVVMGEEGKKPKVVFEGGEEEEADLVIGADGVWSVVKKGMLADPKYDPVYEGLVGVGGFVDTKTPAGTEKTMVFTFGPNGFFGYAPASPTRSMWWSTCERAQPPPSTKIPFEEMRAQLQARHKSWKDPYIQQIVSSDVKVGNIYPVWSTPDLPFWSKGGCVLIGDAAHALNPTSGQGAAQALEDSKALSLCLAKYLAQAEEEADSNETGGGGALSLHAVVDKSSTLFFHVKGPRIAKIAARTKMMAQQKKDTGIVGEMMMCLFLWLAGRFPVIAKMAMGDIVKEMYNWDMQGDIDRIAKELDGKTAP